MRRSPTAGANPRTMEKHVERLPAKSGLARRAELAAWGSRTLRAP